jgi:hypothetical protein
MVRPHSLPPKYGQVAERSKAAVLKTEVGKTTVGSNPTLSANPSILKRLLRRVVVNPANGCWEWIGAKAVGYGRMRIGNKALGTSHLESVHRISYEIFKGAIPDGMDVCHSCDNRGCANPDHLFVGTRKDNMQDSIAKGRFVYNPALPGEAHPQCRLTSQQIAEIRQSTGTSNAVAPLYGVSPRYIRGIRQGRWRIRA